MYIWVLNIHCMDICVYTIQTHIHHMCMCYVYVFVGTVYTKYVYILYKYVPCGYMCLCPRIQFQHGENLGGRSGSFLHGTWSLDLCCYAGNIHLCDVCVHLIILTALWNQFCPRMRKLRFNSDKVTRGKKGDLK